MIASHCGWALFNSSWGYLDQAGQNPATAQHHSGEAYLQ
jgi:hypothetical protein